MRVAQQPRGIKLLVPWHLPVWHDGRICKQGSDDVGKDPKPCEEEATFLSFQKALLTSSGHQSEQCISAMDLGAQLIPPFKRLKITPPTTTPAQPLTPRKEKSRRQVTKATREASVPTWGQLKRLTIDARQVVKGQGVQVSPSTLFVAMLVLVSCQVRMAAAETYWTYVPDPPVVNPATWTGESVPVFTNNTNVVGGSSDKHITPSSQGDYTYNGFSGELPICLSKRGTSGCLQLGQETKTSSGGADVANVAGPWDMGKHIQTVTKLGFPKATRWLSDQHPPLPYCPNSTTAELGAFPRWQDCANPVPVRHNISGSDLYVLDWSHRLDAKRPHHEPMSPGGFVGNALTTETGGLQKDLWRLAAALDFLNFTGSSLADIKGACSSSPCYGLRACVQRPYVLVTGKVNITRLDAHYAVQCHHCNLTSCVSRHNLNEDILILKQPSFIMLPTNITGKWYHDAGLQALQELHNRLSREKRALGLSIFGLATLVTVIASAVTASLALTQSIQNAKFVNELAKNTSTVFHDQEDIDKKLETKLNALEAVVIGLGNQLERVKMRQQLQCHAAFTYICVTSAHYNSSLWDWSKIKMHLQGIWHHNNISIDLVQLHKHVQAIQNSHDEIISPAKLAKKLLDDLKGFNPWNTVKRTTWYLIGFLCVTLILYCFLSVSSKPLRSQVQRLQLDVHELHLKNKKGGDVESDWEDT